MPPSPIITSNMIAHLHHDTEKAPISIPITPPSLLNYKYSSPTTKITKDRIHTPPHMSILLRYDSGLTFNDTFQTTPKSITSVPQSQQVLTLTTLSTQYAMRNIKIIHQPISRWLTQGYLYAGISDSTRMFDETIVTGHANIRDHVVRCIPLRECLMKQ